MMIAAMCGAFFGSIIGFVVAIQIHAMIERRRIMRQLRKAQVMAVQSSVECDPVPGLVSSVKKFDIVYKGEADSRFELVTEAMLKKVGYEAVGVGIRGDDAKVLSFRRRS